MVYRNLIHVNIYVHPEQKTKSRGRFSIKNPKSAFSKWNYMMKLLYGDIIKGDLKLLLFNIGLIGVISSINGIMPYLTRPLYLRR